MIAFPGRLGFFDHARLAEDLPSFAGPIGTAAARGLAMRPPLALLERYGADLLFASPADRGARALQTDAALAERLAAQEFGRACAGDVGLSCLAAALTLGRRDLRPRFRAGDGLDLDAMLRWLVLHGMAEHGLFGLATPGFRRALLRPGRRAPLAPLARLLLAERPDLRPLAATGEPGVPTGLQRWLSETGAAEYRLHWCLPEAWLGPGAPVPSGWSPPVTPPLAPAASAPPMAGHLCHIPLTDDAPLPACVSDRALGRDAGPGVLVHAADLTLRLPHPASRAAVLLIRAAPLSDAPEEAVLVALHGTRALGAARLAPRAGAAIPLVLRNLPPGQELPLRLCRAAPATWPLDRPWARWQDLWLLAA